MVRVIELGGLRRIWWGARSRRAEQRQGPVRRRVQRRGCGNTEHNQHGEKKGALCGRGFAADVAEATSGDETADAE